MNIFRIKLLRNVLLLSLVILTGLPLYNIFLTYPSFNALLTEIAENEATHVAEHLAVMFIHKNSKLKPDAFPEELAAKIRQSQHQFYLEKVKIFSRSGKVIYSTDPEDIGEIHNNNYFYDHVAKGQIYSKEVRKHCKSLSGRIVSADVVETYVPIMNDRKFQGAFEIYYDVTDRKQQFAKLLWHSFASLLALAGGLFVLIIVMLFKAGRTITAQQNAEIELRTSEHFTRTIISSIGEGLIVYDLNLRYKMWNKFMEDLTGMPAAEVIGKFALDLFPHLREQGVAQMLRRALAGETVVSPDTPYYISKTGKQGWVVGLYSPHRAPNGAIIGVVATVKDITKQKQFTEQLSQKNEFLHSVLESLTHPFYVVDANDYKIKMANSAATGGALSKDTTCHRLTHHSDMPCSSEQHPCPIRIIKNERRPVTLEHVHFDKDGNQRNFEVYGYPIFDEKGNVSQIIEYSLDITDRKQAEEALRKSEEKYRLLVTNLPGIVYTGYKDWSVEFIDNKIELMFGYDVENFHSGKMKWSDIIVKEDLESVSQFFIQALKTDKSYVREYRIKTNDESIRWIQERGQIICDSKGGIEYISGVFHDITDRKQAEEALKASHRRFQAVMDSLDSLVYVADMETYKILFINKHGQTIWGDIAGQTCWQTLQDGQTGPCEFCTNAKLMNVSGRPGGIYVWEFQNTITNRWYECRDQAIQWTDGRLVRMEIATDITDRKQAEEALKEKIKEQEVNIDLAQKVLNLVNAEPPRYTELNSDLALFVEAVSAPCSAAGGDHYFVRRLSNNGSNHNNKTVISLKDQSGHEVNCILRSIITDLMHNAILHHGNNLPLEASISRLNDEICYSGFFKPDDFLTSVNVEIDHDTLVMQYVSCGHPAFLLIRANEILSFPAPGGNGKNLPIGAIEGIRYSAGELQLMEGDRLFFYTDGLTEMPLAEHKPRISLNALKNIIGDILQQDPACRITGIMKHVLDTISKSSSQEIIPGLKNTSADDVTILGLEIENQNNFHHEIWYPQSCDHLVVLVNKLYAKIVCELDQHGLELPDLRLRGVVEEAIINAWSHGNKKDPGKPITVRWRYGNDFHFEVMDQGVGFDLKHLADPRSPENLLKESGRGVFLIQRYSDSLRWKSGGSHLAASFKSNSYLKDNSANRHHRPLMSLWRNTK